MSTKYTYTYGYDVTKETYPQRIARAEKEKGLKMQKTLIKGYTVTGKVTYSMNLYDDDGKMIDGNWDLCKDIVVEYDREHPFQHYKIKEDTVKRLAKKYNVSYSDVVKNVELLSGISFDHVPTVTFDV
jgi:hypothetical protein